jgi:SSS family solute:Na+ symporter
MMDKLIFLLYLAIILSVAIYFRTKSKKFSDYTQIGSNFASSKIVFVAAIFTSSVGGGTTFGIPEKVYQGQIYYPLALILVILVDLLIAKYLVARLKPFDAQTVGDILKIHYGKLGKMIGGISTILISVGYMAVQMNVSAYILQFFMDIDHLMSILASYGIIILFNLIGGVRSIFANHVLQFIAIIVSIPVIFFLGINHIGIDNLISYIKLNKTILPSFDSNLLIAVISFSIMSFHPTLIQRVAVSKNTQIVKSAIYIKSAIYFLLILFITFNGIFARMLEQDMVAWQALPYMINSIIPEGLKGLVIVGLMASVISTGDSELNISSLSLIRDIFVNLFQIKDNRLIFILARLFILIFASLGVVMSLYFDNIIDIVIFAAGFWAPVVLVPAIFSLYGIRVSQVYFFLSSILGLCSFLIWEIFFKAHYNINSIIIGSLVSLMIFLLGLRTNACTSKT